MSDGPSREEIEHVRRALERHDSELAEDDDAPSEQPEHGAADEDDEG